MQVRTDASKRAASVKVILNNAIVEGSREYVRSCLCEQQPVPLRCHCAISGIVFLAPRLRLVQRLSDTGMPVGARTLQKSLSAAVRLIAMWCILTAVAAEALINLQILSRQPYT